MFKSSLSLKLQNIFGIKKVSFSKPETINEQEMIYVNVSSCNPITKDGFSICKVEGKISVFAVGEKLPFGYFSKKLYNCDPDDEKDLYFYNLESNINYMGAGGLVERTCDFILFYKEQFNPISGKIEGITFNEV
jgi:hypothetical protein